MSNIGLWQEYISALSDEKFSRLMRLYLGNIKTPYNKLKLTEQLASFIRTPEHTKNFISLIDETDLKFLTAISLIPAMTHEKLERFFQDEFSLPDLYTIIANLTERLLIYPLKNEVLNEEVYKINPLLENEISELLDQRLIFPEAEYDYPSITGGFSLSPVFLSAFISYIRINGIGVKNDGFLKKSDIKKLSEIFGDNTACIQYILNGFLNLSILRDDGKKFILDEKSLKSFAHMPEIHQYAVLCASSSIRLGTTTLEKQAQLLLATAHSVKDHIFSKDSIIRLSYVISSQGASFVENKGMSRFSRLLSQVQAQANPHDDNSGSNLMEDIFDAAVRFGFFEEKGKNEDGGSIYTAGPLVYLKEHDFKESFPKVVNINATSSVTLLPGLTLNQLLPFTEFLQIVKCSTVSEFEITRKSVSTAFDHGYTVEKISALLSDNANFQIPANLIFNLNEWYSAYSSAMLFRGYILKVSKENIVLTENNPNIASHIKEKLADGIYLLDIPLDHEPSMFIKELGIDFMANVKTVEEKHPETSFPVIKPFQPFVIQEPKSETRNILIENIKAAEHISKEMNAMVNQVITDEFQRESFQMRISNRLIVSSKQLVETSIRSEILEASGMDYHGKVHLIEAAIKENELLEISLPSPNVKDQTFSLLGHPLLITKQEGDAVVRMELEPSKEQDFFPVSKMAHVKRIRR